MIYLSKKYKQKPRQWGPAQVVRASVRDYFEKIGIAMPAAFFPLWEGAGSTIKDLADLSQVSFSNGTWTGGGLADDGSQDFLASVLGKSWLSSVHNGSPFTFWCYGDWPAAYDGYSQYGTLLATKESDNGDHVRLTYSSTSSDEIRLTISDGWTSKYCAASKTLYNSGRHSIAIIWDGSSAVNLYADRDALSLSANTISSQSQFPDGSPLSAYLFFRPGLSDSSVRATMLSTAIFLQALSADQIARLYDDPYGAIQRRPMPIFSFASSGVAFKPAWAQNATVTLRSLG